MENNIENRMENPEELKQFVTLLLETNRQNEQEIEYLKGQVCLLRAQLYGKKSEKYSSESGAEQLWIFGQEEEEELVLVDTHHRKKSGRKPLPADLPRKEILHDLDESEKHCDCGALLSRIGEETSEQLDYIPAQVQVLRHIRPKYACKACEGVESNGPTVKIAPPPVQLIPKSIATPRLLAYVLTAKFVDALPFYRQEK